MLKRLVILLLEFGAGLAGNLAAGWIQQDMWTNLFTPTRLLGTIAGAGVMLLVLAWLESKRALPWNWRWHRFWYLRELLENSGLRRWETDFARLELAQGKRKVSGAEVITQGEWRDLIDVLGDESDGRRLFLAVGLLRSVDRPDRELEREVTAALVESLRRGVTPEHKQAAAELARIAGDEVVEALGGLLQNEDQAVREGTVDILGTVGSRKAAEVLTRSFGDEIVPSQVAKVLVSIGEPAVESLVAALQDENSAVRDAAIWALGEIGYVRAVQPLITVLRGQYSETRRAAAVALGKIGNTQAVEPLIEALRDDSGAVREAAVLAMGEIGDERVVELLIRALQDEYESSAVRDAAVWALGEIGDIRAVEPLIAPLWEDRRWDARVGAAKALGKMGEPALRPLISALRDGKGDELFAAAKGLGKMGELAVEPLIAALQDENSVVRDAAISALGEIGDTRAIEPLTAALQDERSYMRGRAVWALGNMGELAVKPLIKALWDESDAVRQDAVFALGEIGEPAVESLSAALRDDNGTVREWAVLALEMIGEPAVEPLIEALQDENSRVRHTAICALREIGEVRALPYLERLARDDKEETPWGQQVADVALEAMEWIRAAQGNGNGQTDG